MKFSTPTSPTFTPLTVTFESAEDAHAVLDAIVSLRKLARSAIGVAYHADVLDPLFAALTDNLH